MSKIYENAGEQFLQAGLNMSTLTIKAALVLTTYTPDYVNHDFYDDISASVIGTPQTILTKTFAQSVFDGDNVTFTAVSGAEVSYILIYEDSGTPATSDVIGLIDTGTGLPFTPNGGDVTISWETGKIFKLAA